MNETCRTSFCNLLMIISEYRKLNMDGNDGNAMVNILFKNQSCLYSPRSEREPKQKMLKLSAE